MEMERTKEQILQGEDERLFMTKCYYNLNLWAERVIGLDLQWFHKEWLDALKKHDRIAVSAAVGHGKTTIFGLTYPIWLAYYKPQSVSLIISKTIRTQSADILERIKTTIETNEILKSLIPKNIKLSWTKEEIVTTNRAKIFYGSYSPNIRGIQADYVFPDEVAVYPDQENNYEIYRRDVSSRVFSKHGKIAAVSTPVHTADLLAVLMNSPGYFSKTYPAIINNKPIWPSKFSMEYLMKEKEKGISQFERNFMCNPRAESENPVFPIKSIEKCYSTEHIFTTENEGGKIFIGADFAIASGPTADFDCYVVVERIGDVNIIRYAEYRRGLPFPAKIQRLKILNEKYNPIRIILDESHIGSAVYAELRAAGVPAECQSFHSAARGKLLTNLKLVIDNKKLVIPYNKEDARTINFANRLITELIGFKEVDSRKTGNKQLLSTAAHDDTVMALALAVSKSSARKPFTDYIASGS